MFARKIESMAPASSVRKRRDMLELRICEALAGASRAAGAIRPHCRRRWVTHLNALASGNPRLRDTHGQLENTSRFSPCRRSESMTAIAAPPARCARAIGDAQPCPPPSAARIASDSPDHGLAPRAPIEKRLDNCGREASGGVRRAHGAAEKTRSIGEAFPPRRAVRCAALRECPQQITQIVDYQSQPLPGRPICIATQRHESRRARG